MFGFGRKDKGGKRAAPEPIEDPVLGTLEFNRQFKWWEALIEAEGRSITLVLNERELSEKVLESARRIGRDIGRILEQVAEFCEREAKEHEEDAKAYDESGGPPIEDPEPTPPQVYRSMRVSDIWVSPGDPPGSWDVNFEEVLDGALSPLLQFRDGKPWLLAWDS